MTPGEARERVVQTGVTLQKKELVARTWGNISQRIDQDTFAVSPSGIFYEDIRPEDVAVVTIEDLQWEGKTKPSSEKGLHRNIYRDHPGVTAIIHTHQPAASAVAAARLPVNGNIPCAPYALPTTKTLAKKAAAVIAGDSSWLNGSLLLANHGALCTGETMEAALTQALELEKAADDLVHRKSEGFSGEMGPVYRLALEERKEPRKPEIFLRSQKDLPPLIAEVFRQRSDRNSILWSREPYTLAYSTLGIPLKPMLDDMAQLIGLSVSSIKPEQQPGRTLRKRESLFIQGEGALCLGADRSDADAVRMVLEKSARAAVESAILGKGLVISLPERLLMRQIYLKKYSRISGGNPESERS